MGDSASQELERYVKYMYFKAAQVIVQSRQGEKIATLSNPKPSSQTWFCVTINVSTLVLVERLTKLIAVRNFRISPKSTNNRNLLFFL